MLKTAKAKPQKIDIQIQMHDRLREEADQEPDAVAYR